MKRLGLLLFLVILVSCGKDAVSDVRGRLDGWDAAAWNRNYRPGDTLYGALLDSLHTLDLGGMSKKDVGHYCLLHTFLCDKAGSGFESDSVIMVAVRCYEKGEDYYNQVRSLIYGGVVKYEMDKGDTTAFRMMKKAESVALETKDTSASFVRVKAFLYSRMGRMLYDDDGYVQAEEYFKKSADEYKLCGDVGNYYIVMTDIVWCHLLCDEYDEAFALLESFDTSELPDYVLSNIYNANTLIIKVSDYKGTLDYRINTDAGEEVVAQKCQIEKGQKISVPISNLHSGSYVLTITANNIYIYR